MSEIFYSNTRIDKNLQYLIKCSVEDNFCLIRHDGRTTALVSALEINRLKEESAIDEIIPLEKFLSKNLDYISCLDRFIQHVLGTYTITVSRNFPFKQAYELMKMGYSIKPTEFDTLPEREIKTETEVNLIKGVLSSVKDCFEFVRNILSEASVTNKGELFYENSVLTSEFLRNKIEQFCYQRQLIAEGTIVSCGEQSANPHCQGYGPIFANQFIVIDLFPYEKSSGYYADITRTFLKGQPSAQQKKMYNTVRHAQQMCSLSPGTNTRSLMNSTLKFLEENGYHTDRKTPCGMFHSLGHGFGLNIHEFPTLSDKEYFLKSGAVVTLEPGLYYPKIGGVRIEDDFLITNIDTEKLSNNIPYDWIVA